MSFAGLLNKRIFDEAHDFRLKLPTLLQDEAMLGRFVVFRNGKVHAAADTFEAAFHNAINLFGANVPFYIGAVCATGSFEAETDIPIVALG